MFRERGARDAPVAVRAGEKCLDRLVGRKRVSVVREIIDLTVGDDAREVSEARKNPLICLEGVICNVQSFLGDDVFLFVAGVSNAWRRAWALVPPALEDDYSDMDKNGGIYGSQNATFSIPSTHFNGNPYRERLHGEHCQYDQHQYRADGTIIPDKRPTRTTLRAAVQSASCLEWARSSGCTWDSKTMSYAAAEGCLKTIQQAWLEGCTWDAMTPAMAAAAGHLEVLRWCRAVGCPWDQRTCDFAANGGHVEVLYTTVRHILPGITYVLIISITNTNPNPGPNEGVPRTLGRGGATRFLRKVCVARHQIGAPDFTKMRSAHVRSMHGAYLHLRFGFRCPD